MADQQKITETFRAELKASPFIMLSVEGGRLSEPLTSQIDEDQPNALYFFVAKDNRAALGGPAMAHFASRGHDFFACLEGAVTQDNERAMIDKLWSKHVESWFPGGKDDPNLTLLRFEIAGAEMWGTDISLAGRVKLLFGGKIQPSEGSSHAVVDNIG